MKRFIVSTAVWLVVSSAVWAQDNSFGYGHPHMSGWGYDGGLMLLGPVFMLVILALLVAGVVAVARSTTRSTDNGGLVSDSAMAVLNQRFAKGDIDAKEFSERKQLLLS